MCLEASAAFRQLLIRIEHVNHGAEVPIGQARIVDPNCGVWGRGSIVREIVNLVNILSRRYAGSDCEASDGSEYKECLTERFFHSGFLLGAWSLWKPARSAWAQL
jgi:hypothetical protein